MGRDRGEPLFCVLDKVLGSGQPALVATTGEIVRVGAATRVAWTCYGVLFGAAAVFLLGFFGWIGAWPVAIVVGSAGGGMALVCFRTARIRLEISTDELVIANQLRTYVVRRDDRVVAEVGRSSNPFGVARAVVLRLTDGSVVRIDASARWGQPDTALAGLVAKLTLWQATAP